MTLKRIGALTEEYCDAARDEGFDFTFNEVPSLECVELPNCNCRYRGWEISDTTTVRGNMYDANADTYASQLGIKAGRLYLFWIRDLGLYGVVDVSYWCL